MQGVLQPPPLPCQGTTETRLPATRLHGRGCRAGTRPKLTNPEQEGTLKMDLLGILLVAWFIWMIWGMNKK
jgi:hypothetical protein|nr:MAG TPA: hypothetical protein [Caudoviricetes sp.]